MAWYGITHSCGHDADHQIYGTDVRGERKKKAASLAAKPCKDCGTENYLSRGQELVDQQRRDGLPELSGSDKQIQFAAHRREKAREDVRDHIARSRGTDEEKALFERMFTELCREHTAAKWWIEANRHSFLRRVREKYRAKKEGKRNHG